jgi:hypothetical protein
VKPVRGPEDIKRKSLATLDIWMPMRLNAPDIWMWQAAAGISFSPSESFSVRVSFAASWAANARPPDKKTAKKTLNTTTRHGFTGCFAALMVRPPLRLW